MRFIKDDITGICMSEKFIVLANQLNAREVNELADLVIATENVRYIYEFACNVKGAPIDKLADAVIAYGNDELSSAYICHFAREVEGAPIDKLEDAIIATGYAYRIYDFASNVKGASITKIVTSVTGWVREAFINKIDRFSSGSLYDASSFIYKLIDAIIATGDAKYIYDVATRIIRVYGRINELNEQLIKKFANALIATKDAMYIDSYIYQYIYKEKMVTGHDRRTLIEESINVIMATGNAEYIYEIARYVKGAPIDKLADAIIATGNAEYIYKFARYVKGAPIDKLADAIIATGNAKYIYEFACNVKGAPIDKLRVAIYLTGDKLHTDLFVYKFGLEAKIRKTIIALRSGNIEQIKEILDSFDIENEKPNLDPETGKQKIKTIDGEQERRF